MIGGQATHAFMKDPLFFGGYMSALTQMTEKAMPNYISFICQPLTTIMRICKQPNQWS
jgi:hypothetical protein